MGQSLQWAAAAKVPEVVPIIKSDMAEDVRCLLLESLPDDAESLKELGFEQCVDNPQRPGHKYMEGYFHAVHESYGHHVDSIHPRWGYSLPRRPAPLPLLAFCEALRRGNASLFARLEKELGRYQNAAPLASVLCRRAHLADLSVQVHWGDDVPAQDVAWHIDAANSFLHVALSLQGRRALHARHHLSRGRLSQNCLVGPNDEREVLWQEEGDVYLSTPCCFPHAVEYPAVGWQDRIVAVQCRLLLTEDELWNMTGKQHTAVDVDPHGGTAAIVFRNLEGQMAAGLSMPTLEDLQSILAELQ
mmetsp:Transcript_6344/g.10735  ORF Transcript_6344/g.10735 Transcript_6344/m.10735 type:complete len:302 (+) Transcript_6344:58-963(+)